MKGSGDSPIFIAEACCGIVIHMSRSMCPNLGSLCGVRSTHE